MAVIYCVNNQKGKHTFYVNQNNKDYYLFSQKFKKSNKEVFQNGVDINKLNDYASHYSTSVRKVVTKVKPYIHYIENEYGVNIYDKTELKAKIQKLKKDYKREKFHWNINDYENEELNLFFN